MSFPPWLLVVACIVAAALLIIALWILRRWWRNGSDDYAKLEHGASKIIAERHPGEHAVIYASRPDKFKGRRQEHRDLLRRLDTPPPDDGQPPTDD